MVEEIVVEQIFLLTILELEITESMTMDTSHTIKILNDLKQLGVKIAVDDFGTGYSIYFLFERFPYRLFENRPIVYS